MKKAASKIILIALLFVISSFALHKFYASIYQINFEPTKKRVEITARIFVEDLNEALEKKYHQKTALGLENESQNDIELLKKYLSEKIIIKINGKQKQLQFFNKELDNNILVCYLKIPEINSISSFTIENTALMETHSEQQNIIQSKLGTEKQSLLLTSDNYKGKLK